MDVTKGKKLAVIGSREFQDYDFLAKELDKHEPSLIISGGCSGADSLSNQYAKDKGLPILIFYPDWSQGKGAGFARNSKIIEAADEVLAFQVNKSKGTQDSINKARKAGKRVYLHEIAIKVAESDGFWG